MSVVSTPPVSPNTIVLRAQSLADKYDEGLVAAGKTITPGMLVERTADTPSPYLTYQPHATAGGAAEIIVAIELALIGDRSPGVTGIGGGTVDDDYAAGDLVRLHRGVKGDLYWMLLPASAAAVVITDWLSSNGDGTLRKETSTGVKLFAPEEAVDNHLNASSKARIRARVI